jgi:hypothetical protein
MVASSVGEAAGVGKIGSDCEGVGFAGLLKRGWLGTGVGRAGISVGLEIGDGVSGVAGVQPLRKVRRTNPNPNKITEVELCRAQITSAIFINTGQT